MSKPSAYTRKILRKDKVYLGDKIKPTRYNHTYIEYDDGYNILEYYGVIRKFLQWKYEIDLPTLELLYFLYPKNYFSMKDFNSFPMKWNNKRMKNLIEKGLIEKFFPERTRFNVYRLTRKGKGVVQKAHKLLSGEIKLTVTARYNKCFRQDATYSQKRFRTIMEDMRELVDKKFNYEEP